MSVGQSNGDPNAPAAPSAGPSSGAEEAECARRVAELEAEVTDLKDRLLRALAEQENARRRGVAATERGLLDVLEKHGIRRIDALGQPFNPDRHEAVYQVTDAEHPAGTVAEVLQPGYLHHDRLLRPAMVGVAVNNDGPAAEVSGEPRTIDERRSPRSNRGRPEGSNGSEN